MTTVMVGADVETVASGNRSMSFTSAPGVRVVAVPTASPVSTSGPTPATSDVAARRAEPSGRAKSFPRGPAGVRTVAPSSRWPSSRRVGPAAGVTGATASRATTFAGVSRGSAITEVRASITCGGGTGSGSRTSSGCWRSRAGSARSVGGPRRSMSTTIMCPAGSVAFCASTATAGSGTSETTSSTWPRRSAT